MTVENSDVIDVIGIDNKSGEVILTVSDHLDWSDTVQHQLTLQKKFNAYLAFVESGEILERYPDSKGKSVAFRVVFKYQPEKQGQQFLERARLVLESAGFKLRWELFAESYGN
jgi:hypothetical protein